jgi:thymidylate synthase (FAD)
VSYENGFGYILPPKIEALGEEAVARYTAQMSQIETWYKEWQEQLGKKGEQSNEDARFVLPNACETRIMLTMNIRELRHFFSLRMCNRAQWEINELATRMHRLCLETAPALFEDAGPACLRGRCPEGEKTCGQGPQKRAEREVLLKSLEKPIK